MARARDLVMGTDIAAFVRGADGTVTAWNPAVARLFARSETQALGCRCCEIVAGRDTFGNDFCCLNCSAWRMAEANRPINPYRLTITQQDGFTRNVWVVIVRVRGAGGPELVHLLEPAGSPCDSGSRMWSNSQQGNQRRIPGPLLTAREVEVAGLLNRGFSTQRIASSLGISTTTVRNHISRCLQKLGVHSRIEAVAMLRRLDQL